MKNTDNESLNLSPSQKKTVKKKSHPFWKVFWLTFLVVSLAYAWYSFYAPPNDIVWAEDMEQAQELAKGADKNMLLFFTGKWCSPCRIMKREVFADKQVAKTINSKLVAIMIDVDDPKVKEIVKRYNAGVTPITIFTDHQGEVLSYAVGKIGKAKFIEMLQKLN